MYTSELQSVHLSMMDMWAQPTSTSAVWDASYSMETMLKLRPHLEELVFRVSEDGRRATGFDRVKALGQAFVATMTFAQLYKDLPEVSCAVLTTAHSSLSDMSTLADAATRLEFQRRMRHPASLIVTSTMLAESFTAFIGALWEQNNQLFSGIEAFCEQALRDKTASIVRAAKKGEFSNGAKMNGRPAILASTPRESNKVNGNAATVSANPRNVQEPDTKNGVKTAAKAYTPMSSSAKERNRDYVLKGNNVQNNGGRMHSIPNKTSKLHVEDLTMEDEDISDGVLLTVTTVNTPVDASSTKQSVVDMKKSRGAATISEVKAANVLVESPRSQLNSRQRNVGREKPGGSYQRPQEKLSYERPKEEIRTSNVSPQPANPKATLPTPARSAQAALTPPHITVAPPISAPAKEQDPNKISLVPVPTAAVPDGKKRKMGDRDNGSERQMKKAKMSTKGRTDILEGFKLDLDNFVRMNCASILLEYNLRGLEPSPEGYAEYHTAITIGEPWEITVVGIGASRDKSEQDAARQALEKLKEQVEVETA